MARSIAREATRLAAEPAADNLQPSGATVESQWAHVVALEPGTKLIITVEGSQFDVSHFLRADASTITVVRSLDDVIVQLARTDVVQISTVEEWVRNRKVGGLVAVGLSAALGNAYASRSAPA